MSCAGCGCLYNVRTPGCETCTKRHEARSLYKRRKARQEHRCPACGRAGAVWTKAAILDALRRDAETRGRAPTSNEWKRSGRGHPSSHTVRLVFGTWKDALDQAGLEPAVVSGIVDLRWNRENVKHAVFEFVYKHGRTPTLREWREAGPDHPGEGAIKRLFGTFNALIAAAGYTPRPPGDTRAQSSFLRCKGCRCRLDERTVGCAACKTRHDRRRQRAA